MAVYYGSELNNLQILAANNPVDGKRDNFVHFEATQGKTYRIAIASEDDNDLGYIRLRAEIGGIVDENPPYLIIENPPNGLVTSEERVEVSGKAIDPVPNASGVRDIQV